MGHIQVQKIDVCWELDEYGDASYLDRTADDHYGSAGMNWVHVSDEEHQRVIAEYGSIYAACEHYAEEDKKRLDAFNRGEWSMMGCYATAELLNTETGVTHWIRTPGLWGIELAEDSSDVQYRMRVEHEELDAINEELAAFGVDPAGLPDVR